MFHPEKIQSIQPNNYVLEIGPGSLFYPRASVLPKNDELKVIGKLLNSDEMQLRVQVAEGTPPLHWRFRWN